MKKVLSAQRTTTPRQVQASNNSILYLLLADSILDVREAVLAHGGEPGEGMIIRITVEQQVDVDE